MKFSVNTTLLTKVFTVMVSYPNRLTRYLASHPGLFCLLLGEYEECISGQEAGNGDIQDGHVLPKEID